ncbi:MAG: SdpI family protein [Candidatus ainarchaeum sp.]|nr:SdpI family protein [Candidatus ainarchaeum sp.]
MNSTKLSYYLIFLMLVISLISSFLVFDLVPNTIPSHWNAEGKVDGYSPKELGLFLMPIITILVIITIIIIPKIDPKKKNIKKFRFYFDVFVVTLTGFLLYLHFLTIFYALELIKNMILMLLPAFAFLFFVIGIMVEKAKQNYTIGIRTPWTLANEKVWEKTHEKTGKWIKIASIITLIGIFFQGLEIFFILTPIIIVFIISTIYSYYLFSKIKNK